LKKEGCPAGSLQTNNMKTKLKKHKDTVFLWYKFKKIRIMKKISFSIFCFRIKNFVPLQKFKTR